MSCNGCRVLRKGCSENCMLRHCLQLIENPQAQAHATLFVAKFFGRAALMSFLSAVPANQRSALFQSLLYEAVGRTINPVNGAVGLLWSGNWQLCQMGVEKVLRGGTLCHQAKKQRVGTTSQESETFYMGRKPQDSAPQSQRNLLTLFF
ncbi:LOB domain-containing protein 38 isoform X2 [Vigna radiata var. radiata]|uniref:LOB domain-containing protein 38 isoform X2 n=1 Tax=Vigna radiata var. radiata TaxID=3916 RepID=A0A1S3V7D4_VIGRR|nr:LOB domain-containing protein 38 isoform X2 [Vigna radiata var. radiata]